MFRIKSRRSNSQAQAQSPAHSLEFTSIPIEAAITMLRQVGEDLFTALLQQQKMPTLAELLSPEQMRLLRPPNRRTVSRKRMGRRATSFRAMLTRAQRQVAYRRRISLPLLDNVERQLEGISPAHIPPTFWALITARAWGSLEFRQRIAEKAITHLRARVLMLPGEFPIPLFAPNTFWLLIALAEPMPKRRFPFNLIQWQKRRTLRRWQKEAEGFAKERYWAGFWDQWILLEALRSRPAGLAYLDSKLRHALLKLPLRQSYLIIPGVQSDETANKKQKDSKLALATLAWVDEIEPYWQDNLAHWLELAMLPETRLP